MAVIIAWGFRSDGSEPMNRAHLSVQFVKAKRCQRLRQSDKFTGERERVRWSSQSHSRIFMAASAARLKLFAE
ncbi:MAG: hypothetical protein J5999_00055 [Oscillospiraceae bacterium]|nr:hypothetical protein [Oscillospiraceae bacterium]